MGNHSELCSPHSVYPCAGEDQWCAISVTTDDEWKAFLNVVADPRLADARFATTASRKQHEDELDKIIGQWTAPQTSKQVMDRLQAAGVMAAMVSDNHQVLEDPQFLFRKHWKPVQHTQLGPYEYSDAGFRLEKAQPVLESAPLFGEHKKYVCTELLGMSETEFDNLLKQGVFD
jgi:benzylsuccinate CoA-transferase BbsF subunit